MIPTETSTLAARIGAVSRHLRASTAERNHIIDTLAKISSDLYHSGAMCCVARQICLAHGHTLSVRLSVVDNDINHLNHLVLI